MDETQKQFLDIVTQVRTHLELQAALGLNAVETVSPGAISPAPAVSPIRAPIATKQLSAAKPPAEVNTQGLAAVLREFSECKRCELSAGRKNIVFGEGNSEARLVFIGEAPGQEEEDLKRPFAGLAGELLMDIIVKGMKLKPEDVYICTIVKCRPPGHRKPGPDEINACETILTRQIEAIGPKVIVALGGAAASSLLKTSEGITTIRGKWQAYNGIPVMPTFHPAHILKKASDKKLVWEDIKKVMVELEKVKKG